MAIIRHLPRLDVPGFGSPLAFRTASPSDANSAQVGMFDMIDDSSAVPMPKPTTSFRGDFLAHFMIIPAMRVGMVVEAMAVVMDMVPTMKKNTEPPKPLNMSFGESIFMNTSSVAMKMPVTAMFMVSVTHSTMEASMMPKDCMPGRVSPSGHGRKLESSINAAAMNRYSVFRWLFMASSLLPKITIH